LTRLPSEGQRSARLKKPRHLFDRHHTRVAHCDSHRLPDCDSRPLSIDTCAHLEREPRGLFVLILRETSLYTAAKLRRR